MDKQKQALLLSAIIVLCLITGIIIKLKGQSVNKEQVNTENMKANQSNLPRDKLLKYMKTISGSKTMSGVDVGSTGADRNKGVKIIQEWTGTSPCVLVIVMPVYSEGVTQWQSLVDEIISNWKNGYLMYIIWGWRSNPLSQMDHFKTTGNLSNDERKWTDLITDGGELNNEWKKQLDSLVPYFQQLESAGVVVFGSLLPDINNKDYYLWRGRPGVNGSRRLYQITHDYITQHHHVNCIIWTWHLNNLTQIEEYWPGTHYVDMVSLIMRGEELSTRDYQTLLSVVGDTPISMDYNYKVPTPQYLALQPRWAWFALSGKDIALYNDANSLNATFRSSIVVNKGDSKSFKP